MEDINKITELYNDFKSNFSDSDTDDEYYRRTSVAGFVENLNECFEEAEENLKKNNSKKYKLMRKIHDEVLNDLIEYKDEIGLDETSDTDEILEGVRSIVKNHIDLDI